MIAFECSSCGKPLKVKDELAGKKVKCPGCQKPVAVPQSAASLTPPPAALGEERTLPPKAPSPGEERILPPKNPESVSDADGRTGLGAAQAEPTRSFQMERPGSELTDFLAPAQGPDEIGRLGGFRILKILGHGGMGVVFQGEDPKLGRKVAIKAMLPHLAGSKSSHERFLREAKAAAALQHDHIVPIFHVGEDRGAPFIVMPFLEGEPLDERLKRDKVLPITEVLRIGRETAKGLAAAHEKGLIHRDIKPANIWLDGKEGRVKILDFGLARAAGESGLTQTGAIVGTPQYMAPEQAEGKKDIDHRCDLFSLGCVLYRMCAGELPFKGDSTLAIISALAMHNPKQPSKINKSVPQPLSNLIMHLLAKNPEDRPQTAQEVAEALAQLTAKDTAQIPAKANKTTLFQKPRSVASGRKWAWIAAALVLLVVVGGLALFLRSGKTDPGRGSQDTGSLPATLTNALGMEFVLVPKGKSWLGGGGGKPGDKEVEITEDFYLGRYEVTQEQWEKVMGLNPSSFKAVAGIGKEDQKRFPVEQVSWDDCQLFIERLNKEVKEAGWVYRLPTEMEWEYACRGGPMKDKLESAFDFYFERATNTLSPEQANFDHGKGLKRTCKVGSYQPNRLGLYDMHGNVWEWCEDEQKEVNGAVRRVLRSGGWNNNSGGCRAVGRGANPPSGRHNFSGLRLARVPVGKESAKIFANTLGMEFVLVPKGKSWLGGGGGKPGDKEVEITEDFYLGKYEVTQEEWEKVTGNNPSSFKAVAGIAKEDQKRFPVEQVSWDDAQAFVERLNKQVKDLGWVYRLPTEVEWEYAGRGGPMKGKLESEFDFYFEKASNTLLPDQANFEYGRGLKRTCKVGSYTPNRLGLYDMHGNVWEWCDDAEKAGDGAWPRVVRGGCWGNDAGNCRAAVHLAHQPLSRSSDLGLRVARVPVGKEPPPPQEKKTETPATYTNSLGMEFVLVPKGKSWLGGGGGKPGDKEVEIKEDFYLGKYEVTQDEWEKVMGKNPSAFKEVAGVPKEDLKRFPVEQVSWDDAQLFLSRLNGREKEAGWVYRLPKEAEWEYACRGGPLEDKVDSAFDFYFDKPSNLLLPEQANFLHGKGLKRTCKVGSYKANPLGVYDMHGNVWEWCEDEVPDPNNPKVASQRVIRGGSWYNDSGSCRAGPRNALDPATYRYNSHGLRLARVPVGKDIVKIAPEEKKPAVEAKLPPKLMNTLGMEFVLVPKGKSWLGGGGGNPGDKEVEIVHDFYLGRYEVTQEEWEKVTGINPAAFKAVPGVAKDDQKRFPVEMVSWEDAQAFIQRLNKQVKDAGWVYRLPKEMEWEYACRGGPGDKFDSGFDFYLEKPTNQLLPEHANFDHGKRLTRTCKVGSYPANRLGLYDMHGNVWEWCADEVKDAKGASRRVSRGGSWSDDAGHCRAANRTPHPPSGRSDYLGVRLARVLAGKDVVKIAPEEKKPAAADYALRFKANDQVVVSSLKLPEAGPLTLEAFVTVDKKPAPNNVLVLGFMRQFTLGVPNGSWQFSLVGEEPGTRLRCPAKIGQRVHVACIRTAQQMRLYVGGKMRGIWPVAGISFKGGKVFFRFGGGLFEGIIDEVRVSKVARYDEDFTPFQRFEPDADTLALYHCDEGQGDLLKDSSGHGHDGKISGPSWVKANGSPIAAVVEAAFSNALGMEFVLVPKGKSWLGGGGGTTTGTKEVEIANDFYLGRYEVTQEEWEKVTGFNPSTFKAVPGVAPEDQKRFPAENVSWDDAQTFIRLVNEKSKEPGWVYRLPKEAEWEYACRGGPLKNQFESAFDFYLEKPTNLLLPDHANFNNVLQRTCKVGSYNPNRLGLHDMHGNVWEWCDDAEKAPEGGLWRVPRGGSWSIVAANCRAAYRYTIPPSVRDKALGLRLARVPVGKESK